MQYWVVYAFLTVFESLVSAVYWFRKQHYQPVLPNLANSRQLSTTPSSSVWCCGWLFLRPRQSSIPEADQSSVADLVNRGAQIIFRSLIQPVFSRFFSTSGNTASNLRSQADQASKPHAM